MSTFDKAIGGYFEFELPGTQKIKYENAVHLQSARSSFLVLLRATKPKRVWMPYYICDSMLAPIKAVGAEICFYGINDQFDIADSIKLGSEDILLYVNYFGICGRQVYEVLRNFNPAQVILDFSQALYAQPHDCLGTIYSPRKFFGIPDGGLLISSLSIELPLAIDTDSETRLAHLFRRLGSTPESGYEDYQRAESSLNELEPKQMSQITERILSSIDFDMARSKRNKNFSVLHNKLGKTNKLNIDAGAVDGPLCYPYLTNEKFLRNKLIAERVFVPTYWIDAVNRVGECTFESQLVKQCLPLPCDQRYDQVDMARIVDLLA